MPALLRLRPSAAVAASVLREVFAPLRTPLAFRLCHFAEAYASSAIDIEGDLFAAMHVANEVESIKVGFGQRLRILRSLWHSPWRSVWTS
jgi:hypothetical protein